MLFSDSMESESFVSEEPQYLYTTPTGYVDPTSGIYYVNGELYTKHQIYVKKCGSNVHITSSSFSSSHFLTLYRATYLNQLFCLSISYTNFTYSLIGYLHFLQIFPSEKTASLIFLFYFAFSFSVWFWTVYIIHPGGMFAPF